MSYETMKTDLECLSELKHEYLRMIKEETAKGCLNINTTEMGEVVDIVKDFAETERNCLEAMYYKTVTEAMEAKDYDPMEPAERLGYNNYHYNNGRFAMKNTGHSVGYRPYLDQEPYVDEYLNNPNFKENMRMGYPMNDMSIMYNNSSRYGRVYDGYRNAKRHYTEHKSNSDKMEMEKYSKEYLEDTIDALKEMWADGDPEHRKRIKEHLTQLINTMTV